MLYGAIAGVIAALLVIQVVTRWPTKGPARVTSWYGWLLCLITCFAVMGTVALITWGSLITFNMVPK